MLFKKFNTGKFKIRIILGRAYINAIYEFLLYLF
jgi:hypothetical protein